MYKKILFISLTIILFLSNILFAQTITEIALKPGFNFISFTNLITLNPSELKALNNSIEDIFLFSSSAGSFLSVSEGTLTNLSAGKGYIIKSKASSDIKISVPGSTINLIGLINLKTGFNLVGFSQAPSTNTFEKLMTNNTIIKGCYKWSPTAGSFIQVLRDELGVINKIDGVDPTIKAGESYFLNMYGDTVLTYDTTSISLNPSSYDLPRPKVANPIITPNGGTVSSSQQITIICTTEGAEINYVIDNNTSTKYTGPLTITKNCTLKVTAIKSGWTNSDLITVTYMLANPELEISGTLPNTGTNSSKNYLNYSAAIGTKGNTILVVKTDNENIEVGTIAVNLTNYIATIPLTDTNYTATIILKDNLGRILFRNLLGKMPVKSELPSSTTKIKISNINVDSTSTALALLAKEKNIEVGKITSISSNDLQNGIATKTSNISNEIAQNFTSNPSIISEITKAVNTITTTVLSASVSTTIVPINISNATELLSSFVKVIKEPSLQTIINQNQLSTSIILSQDQIIDSGTNVVEPILKVKTPVFSNNGSSFINSLKLSISCPTSGSTIKYTLDGTIPSSTNGLIYDSTLSIEMTSSIKAIAIKPGMIDSEVASKTYTKIEQVSVPTFNPSNSEFESSQQVAITSATAGATIYYTTDNTIPTLSSNQYISPFIITATTNIKAIAIKNGYINSEIAISSYTKLNKIESPVFTPSTGTTFSSNQQITIKCATPGVTIYYTTDGKTPTLSSNQYTEPFTINTTSTIKAIAIKNGMANSEIIITNISHIDDVLVYKDNGNSINITGYKSTADGNVIVPDTINGKPVTSIGNAFRNRFDLKSITIPNSITSIDEYAFSGCTGLTSVTLPNTMTKIGGWSFMDCRNLKNITIPNNLTFLGDCVFSDCTSLTNLTLPNSIQAIGSNVFLNCSNLTDIILPNTIDSIGDHAFRNCINLKNITIPNSVRVIYADVFSGCSSLTNITIPNSVTYIGEVAFRDCVSLKNIILPNSVTIIGNEAFIGCSGLTNISLSDNITSLPRGVFSSCKGLTNIAIPKNVSIIYNYAFSNCSKLTSINFYGNAPATEEEVFYNCSSDLKFYYIEGKTGWTNPWNGHTTTTFVPSLL